MKTFAIYLAIALVIFGVCFFLVFQIGKAFIATVPALKEVVLLFSVLISIAMTIAAMFQIHRALNRRR
jgi:hypothetical protein